MFDHHPILAVIPARGGSKGIPRKNVRLLGGRPLIAHVVDAARRARLVDHVVVTTDDDEIATIAARYGARILKRPAALAGDTVTLDPVVFHAVRTLERRGVRADAVLTLQPTSPLISPASIDAIAARLFTERVDTIISVQRIAHLYWERDAAGHPRPLYRARLNRQELPPLYSETGAVLAARRTAVTAAGRIGAAVELHELPAEECIDIDDESDWWLAERLFQRRHIVFHVRADRTIGTGHVYRALTLARRLTGHRITFAGHTHDGLLERLVAHGGFSLAPLGPDWQATFRALQPDIVINDVLDSDPAVVRFLRHDLGAFVVNFEDLGPGAREADLVFNAMYGASRRVPGAFAGALFECLREEFYDLPDYRVRPQARRVLVSFGGSDPCNLTVKTLRALDGLRGDFDVQVVLGLGYPHAATLRETLAPMRRRVQVKRNVASMSRLMSGADLLVTSYGRTLFEAAAVGVPAVALAQNARELRHVFAHPRNGVLALGLGTAVPVTTVRREIGRLLGDAQRRAELSTAMRRSGVRSGRDILIDMLFEHYRRRTHANPAAGRTPRR